ncbi:MAG: DUF4423 domain-containing protein [Deltaproteobacteria bacterium]|nr:MAG: DUF4423 domain-containing protein [Deltaproteobacteria bacterium]
MDHELLARELIRALRGSRSQVALSRRLGYTSNVVYAWEAGRRWPTAAETLRAAARVGVDVEAAVVAFFRRRPTWLDEVDPASPEGVAALLTDLRGSTPLVEVAARIEQSRYTVSRWCSGQTEPRLPDFLRLVEVLSLRTLDLLSELVPIESMPSARRHWRAVQRQRDLAYERPWTQAILRVLELEQYHGGRDEAWMAGRLGIATDALRDDLEALRAAGVVHRHRGRWVARELAVDTRPSDEANRALKAHWAEVAAERVRSGDDGLFAYNVFSCSRDDLARLRALQLAAFRELRSVVASSPPEVVAVVNQQLFALDGD